MKSFLAVERRTLRLLTTATVVSLGSMPLSAILWSTSFPLSTSLEDAQASSKTLYLQQEPVNRSRREME